MNLTISPLLLESGLGRHLPCGAICYRCIFLKHLLILSASLALLELLSFFIIRGIGKLADGTSPLSRLLLACDRSTKPRLCDLVPDLTWFDDIVATDGLLRVQGANRLSYSRHKDILLLNSSSSQNDFRLYAVVPFSLLDSIAIHMLGDFSSSRSWLLLDHCRSEIASLGSSCKSLDALASTRKLLLHA